MKRTLKPGNLAIVIKNSNNKGEGEHWFQDGSIVEIQNQIKKDVFECVGNDGELECEQGIEISNLEFLAESI